MIKFNRYCVTDGQKKARVWYSLDNRADGRKCVTLYEKDYARVLADLFPSDYENDTDIMTDYFDNGRVRLFEGSPFYAAARARAEQIEVIRAAKLKAAEDARAARRAALLARV